MSVFNQPVNEKLKVTMDEVTDSARFSKLALGETIIRLHRDVEELELEYQFLRTPRAAGPMPFVQQAAHTMPGMPWLDGSTSWQQYLLVFNKRMDQTDELLRKILEALQYLQPTDPPTRVPESSSMDKLLGMLSSQMKHSEPMVPPVPAPTGLEDMLRSYFAGVQSPKNAIPGRSGRRDWSEMKCFSCGQAGHSATSCSKLDASFPFIPPGWKAEKTSTGYVMISPRMATARCRAENGN